MGRRIVLGVGGGIAAYKAALLLRRFKEAGHDVRVVPTAAALNFVGAPTWSALSGHPVSTEVWDDVHEVPHVRIGQEADLVVVAPATADLLARAAHGLADDLLTNVLLTARCPVLLAPAMHTEMWTHPATVANVATLRERGVHVVEPASGRLTGADTGPGRLPEPDELFAAALALLDPTGPATTTAVGPAGITGSAPAAVGPAASATVVARPVDPRSADADLTAGIADLDDRRVQGTTSAPGIAPDLADPRVPATGQGDLASGSGPRASSSTGVVRDPATDRGDVASGTGPRASSSTETVRDPAAPFGDRVAGTGAPAARANRDLNGLRVVVSAGGTREPLDPVRFLGNRSSGRQGVALARAALDRGAKVTLVAGPIEVPAPEGADLVRVETALQMRDAMTIAAGSADVLVMAAAVADFRPAQVAGHKIKKDAGTDDAPVVTLVRNPDILAGLVAARRPGQIVVGFAAETGDETGTALEHATAKLARKGCDLLVLNDVAAGKVFGRDDTEVVVLGADGSVTPVPPGTKEAVAEAIWDAVQPLLP